ncbi:OsmC family protein [Exilibacterium tricleocarpae]|uniref:OsmC family protein n=1 Tax=Exilibacterium tricleocarpae TaxID=2591008 RepID=A0A545SZ04_9GAMM|nr:OsmC family protein [Exilibacterium tricleocarpae]TQV70198.1 OsmC family protein [Exilibacterium tricleocarpae]
MQAYPHQYRVQALAESEGDVRLAGAGLPPLASAPPPEFGGPGDRWSPETLLAAAVADCFVLTFRAIARASKFAWTSLDCEVEGVLDQVDGSTRFTAFTLTVALAADRSAAAGPDLDREAQKARRLLQKAEHSCLITQSLRADTHLDISIDLNP